MTKAVGVNLRDVLEAGIRSTSYSQWHQEVPDGLPFKYYWHASGLGYCSRKLILQRAGLATDGKPFDGAMTLRLGTVAHSEIERCIQVWQSEDVLNREIIVQEVGYYHPDMPLAAKPDGVIRNYDSRILVDFKTEHELAAKRRQEEARAAGRRSSAKYEHMLQEVATAMVLEANGIPTDEGRVWYLTKSAWWPDDQPVDVNDPGLRREVERLVSKLESAWQAWEARADLPSRLPKGADWQCTPRPGSNLGKWCEARANCFKPNMPA